MNNKKNALPLVVIFGRANVGKSTLFNCLIEKNKALVSKIPGTTRDSNRGLVGWQGHQFNIIDTGGILDINCLLGRVKNAGDIDNKVQAQARDFLKRADLILFMVDAKTGLLPQDRELALLLKKERFTDKVVLAVNKVDRFSARYELPDFNKLALGHPWPIAASAGIGTGDLLDEITKKIYPAPSSQGIIPNDKKLIAHSSLRQKPQDSLEWCGIKKEIKKDGKEPSAEDQSQLKPLRVAIIGKPNVGKSALLNKLIGEERVIVSPIPHTTREPQDIQIAYNDFLITFIDTAGISKKGLKSARRLKRQNTLEKFSIAKSLAVLKKADLALLVLDINKTITQQDAKLVEKIIEKRTSLIFTANKWDLIEVKDTKAWRHKIYSSFPFATWVPIQFTSALTGEKISQLLKLIVAVAEAREASLPDNALSRLLSVIVKKHRPTKAKGGKHPFIYELKQITVNPPCFKIRVGVKNNIHVSYLRYIENQLRQKFGFAGTPLTVWVDKKKRIHGQHKKIINSS